MARKDLLDLFHTDLSRKRNIQIHTSLEIKIYSFAESVRSFFAADRARLAKSFSYLNLFISIFLTQPVGIPIGRSEIGANRTQAFFHVPSYTRGHSNFDGDKAACRPILQSTSVRGHERALSLFLLPSRKDSDTKPHVKVRFISCVRASD